MRTSSQNFRRYSRAQALVLPRPYPSAFKRLKYSALTIFIPPFSYQCRYSSFLFLSSFELRLNKPVVSSTLRRDYLAIIFYLVLYLTSLSFLPRFILRWLRLLLISPAPFTRCVNQRTFWIEQQLVLILHLLLKLFLLICILVWQKKGIKFPVNDARIGLYNCTECSDYCAKY